MSFLWDRKTQLLTSHKSPSPKHRKISAFRGFIERASGFFSLKRRVLAGMTVEAAMVLPLFLFFFLNLSSVMEMMRLHSSLQMALWDVGNRMCVYGYVAERADEIWGQGAGEDGVANKDGNSGEKGAWWNDLADVALSYTYIKQEVIAHAGREYLEDSPLSRGCGGLQFWESDLFSAEGPEEGKEAVSGDLLDIVLTYQVAPQLAIPAAPSFRMFNRYYGHLWTGYDVGSAGEGPAEEQEQDVVYITDHASVYHESLECTHLKLSVREVPMSVALSSRNQWGKRYGECSKCKDRPVSSTVFITNEGDYYHYDRGCSGLKRTIHTIPRKEAEKYKPCSRCAVSK